MAKKYVDIEERPLSTPLYHYTSVETMERILRTKVLWASNVAFMNDGSEFEFGLGIFKRMLTQRIQEETGRAQDLAASLLSNIDARLLQQLPATFVLCFTEQPNLLSQWSMYTPHGRGVSIGFDPLTLIERSQSEKWHWNSCKYTPEAQMSWVDAMVERLMRELTKLPDELDPNSAVSLVLDKSGSAFFGTMAILKNPAFAAEKEWRLISPPIQLTDAHVKFRPGVATLIPYVEFELCDDKHATPVIAETWIGPTSHPKHTLAVVSAVQRQCGVPGNIVHNSMIPYRQI